MSEMTISPSFLIDWMAAETAAMEHMKRLGFVDAQVTPPGADGGIDVVSSDAVAQVKFYANPIGRPDIQRLRGAAHEYRLALFYSTGGYTKESVEYANGAGVALFLMDAFGNSQPASDLALLLVEPHEVHERRERLEALQSVQFGFAASAVESDLVLLEKFSEAFSLSGVESSLFGYVLAELTISVDRFRNEIESRKFSSAEATFSQVRSRISFLVCIAGPGLVAEYSSLEDAMSEGWKRDSTPGSDYLLDKAAAEVAYLREFLHASYSGWEERFPPSVRLSDLVDEETSRLAEMLAVAAAEATLLSPTHLQELKKSLKAGVRRSSTAANKIAKEIEKLHNNLGLPVPRTIAAQLLRIELIVARILLQLDRSTNAA